MTLKKQHENNQNLQKKSNIFSRTWKKVEEIKEALSYELPEATDIVALKWNEWIEELENERFINKDNFRLQIWKMQKDWNTIYSPLMLKFWLEYIANHINTDEEWKAKAIIQLRPDLAQCLLQEDKEILTFEEEKKEIEKLIKKTLGKKWKFIEIQNVADNYPDVFNAIKNWKNWIIPSKEPVLENIKLPIESPLPIIKFLAYHAKNDPKLMDVFYRTKPAKYIWQDTLNNNIPWSSDADYYSIVEVWIRLFEVLNWISIQWWIGRQRVYDKIISLIIFGKDKIGKANDYDINNVLKLEDYPALNNLHTRLINSWIYSDVSMNQLYIELNEWSLGKIEKKVEKKQKYNTKFRKLWTWLALASALTLWWGKFINSSVAELQQKKANQELINLWEEYPTHIYDVYTMDYTGMVECEESIKLKAEYDLSKYEYTNNKYYSWHKYILKRNKIVDEYMENFWPWFNWCWETLTAEDFMKHFWWKLINQYGLPYCEPYQHLKERKQEAINNTLKYWNNINLSENIVKKSKEKTIYTYYNIGEKIKNGNHWDDIDHLYQLKFIKVLIDGEYKELILAAKYNIASGEAKEEFTLENWIKCMEDLQENYWLDIPSKV